MSLFEGKRVRNIWLVSFLSLFVAGKLAHPELQIGLSESVSFLQGLTDVLTEEKWIQIAKSLDDRVDQFGVPEKFLEVRE